MLNVVQERERKMKKFIIIIIAISLIVTCLYLVSNNRNQSGEAVAIFHQLNPFVKKENSYIKTKNPDEILDHNRASYTQKVYNAKGEGRTLTFSAIEKLKVDRYMKIVHKGAHVETYKEVKKNEVPKKALKEIE
ncbi:YxeA family protein [Staphylococcus succinus]|nr:YxeA family protein [Staphylococcus succinus]